MKRGSLLILLAIGLIPLSGLLVGHTATIQNPQNEQEKKFEDDNEDEGDRILERIRLYLRRHGDSGRIDPERRLQAIRQESERFVTEQAKHATRAQAVQDLNWVSVGPSNGAGRTVSIAPHPTEANTIFVGAAGGGVWKTTDGGGTLAALTDSITDLSVGAIALAPSNPDIIYLGTGEGGIAIDFIPGVGLLKSTDGGKTWIFPSSVIASNFYRILVNPTNPQELLAGTNRGGLRSTDGGGTWTEVISNATYQDVADMVRHPTAPQTIYAATWDRRRWCAFAGTCSVQSSSVLKSTDGGVSWTRTSQGLPTSTASLRVERMSLAISPSNPSILYASTAIFDAASGATLSHMYKTTDAAASWTELTSLATNQSSTIRGFLGTQGWYDNTIVVSPTDPNTVIAGGVRYVRTTDGGNTWGLPPLTASSGAPSVHVDVHDLRYQGSRLYIANDGGVWSSPDNGTTSAAHINGLVTRQYYAMAHDAANRNRIFGGTQDNGTSRRADIGGTSWAAVIGGDGFECGVSPSVPSYAFGTVQGGLVFRAKDAGADPIPRFASITPPYDTGEVTPFLSLLTVDQSALATIYTGSYRVWRSTDNGDSWSPLPTTTTDGSVWTTTSTISAIAVARSNNLVLMASRGAIIFKSTNGGNTWARLSVSPTNGINNVEIDPRNPDIAYAAMSGTTGTRVYRTTDGGQIWNSTSNGLPSFSAQVVRVDPADSNVVYCGTDVGVYRSNDAGLNWERFGTGLPSTSVHDLRILEDGSILRVATHGRGIWELRPPSTGNNAPNVAITSPSTMSVLKGETLDFTGMVSDSDGDPVTGTWTFPDTWESVSTGSGPTTVSHTFSRFGIFPVTLVARDNHGSVSSSEVFISVKEQSDDCATPLVLPGNGPFPISIVLNNEASTIQQTDPPAPCITPVAKRPNTNWLSFTPDSTGDYEFSTCGANLDTVLSVWTGGACGPYTLVACNDDVPAGVSGCFVAAAYVVVHASAGQTLRILVSVFDAGSATGTFTLTVRKAFSISGASIDGKRLLVSGTGFQQGADILVNGERQKKTSNDEQNPSTLLISKKAGKNIQPGTTVMIQVRNPDGTNTDSFSFTRPLTSAKLVTPRRADQKKSRSG